MSTSIVVAFPLSAAELSQRVDALRGHSFATPSLYKDGAKAIATCRELRVQIEERRKLLKQDSLEYGRKVDAVAKELTAIIEAVESGLKSAKLVVDNEKERLKHEAAEAKRLAVEAEVRAKREAEEAALREQRQAEEAKLAAERLALAAERAAIAKEREASTARALEEQRILDETRRLHQAELAELRAQKETAARELRVKEDSERKAAEAEEQRINALEYERVKAKRLDALKPDQDKLTQFARAIRNLLNDQADWEFDSESAVQAYKVASVNLEDVADELDRWKESQS